MSVYIKGMEMPTSCSTCKLFGEYGCLFVGAVGYALTRGERCEDCPLIPVPDHGRLIDADALWDVAYKAWGTEYDPWVCNLFMEMINNAPTIIPADKEGEG